MSRRRRNRIPVSLVVGEGALPIGDDRLVSVEAAAWSRDHDQLNGHLEELSVPSKYLAQPALDAISTNGVSDLAADGDTQGRRATGDGKEIYDEVSRLYAASFLQHVAKLPGVEKSAAARKPFVASVRAYFL